jgi:HAD superfamily hydrolase (TIGR01490 family)
MPRPDRSLTSPGGTAVAAFFDVDNTLVPGWAIEVRFLAHLWRCGRIGSQEIFRSAGFLLRHLPPLSWHPLREYKLYLDGKPPAAIEPVADAFVRERICPRISAVALQAIERHRQAGHELVLVTASPDFLIMPLAAHLKIATVLAATPERHGDRYTGHILPPLPYGAGKRTLMERFAKQHGLDLRYSYAYGDSPGDIEALRSVGHPIVVNPIRGMRRIARHEGWPIERWP